MASKMYMLMKREVYIENKEYTCQIGESAGSITRIDDGHLALSACHGTLMCYLKYKDTPEMQDWLLESFRKCLCVVTEGEYQQAKQLGLDHVVVNESAFGDEEVGLVFKPMEEFPKCFKFYRLFKGGLDNEPKDESTRQKE
jgi:hypothetical protein